MKNFNKSKNQLIIENEQLQKKITELQKSKQNSSGSSEFLVFNIEKYGEILNNIKDGIVVFDKEMNYVFVNNYGAEILGTKPDQLIGKNYWTEYPEAKNSIFTKNYLKALNTQTQIVFEDYFKPWNRWFENRIFPNNGGIIILFTEITDRKKADLKDEEYRKKLEKIIKIRTDELETTNEELKSNIEQQQATIEELDKANKELERFNKLFIDREFRIKELRDKVKELEGRLSNR
ncbi:MAG: PAS domain-containing protein [Chlorobi bacterium]|nr:PAS domain-containing protein [Chlorobiota bacterium]